MREVPIVLIQLIMRGMGQKRSSHPVAVVPPPRSPAPPRPPPTCHHSASRYSKIRICLRARSAAQGRQKILKKTGMVEDPFNGLYAKNEGPVMKTREVRSFFRRVDLTKSTKIGKSTLSMGLNRWESGGLGIRGGK